MNERMNERMVTKRPAPAPDSPAAPYHEADLHKALSDHPNVVTLYGREIAAVKMADKSQGIQVMLMMELCTMSLVNHVSAAVRRVLFFSFPRAKQKSYIRPLPMCILVALFICHSVVHVRLT